MLLVTAVDELFGTHRGYSMRTVTRPLKNANLAAGHLSITDPAVHDALVSGFAELFMIHRNVRPRFHTELAVLRAASVAAVRGGRAALNPARLSTILMFGLAVTAVFCLILRASARWCRSACCCCDMRWGV